MDARRLAVALLAALVLGAGSALIMLSLRSPQVRRVDPIQLRQDTVDSRVGTQRRHHRNRKKQTDKPPSPRPVSSPTGSGAGASIRVPPPARAGDDDNGDESKGDDDNGDDDNGDD